MDKHFLSMFTPETCKVSKKKCYSALYLETCKWASGRSRSYCRKRRRTYKKRISYV